MGNKFTGMLVFDGEAHLTAIIETFFSRFNLKDLGGNKATLYSDHIHKWEEILDELYENSQKLGVDAPKVNSVEKWIDVLDSKFNSGQRSVDDIQFLDSCKNFEPSDTADLEDLYKLSIIFNDGHNLRFLDATMAWHSNENEECGADVSFVSKEFVSYKTTESIQCENANIFDGLDSGNYQLIANTISQNMIDTIKGISDLRIREQVLKLTIDNLMTSLTPKQLKIKPRI